MHNYRFRVTASLLLISILVGLSACKSVATPTAAPTLAPTPTLPTDLGASLITKHTYPSLSYGIQAFLWWNATTRPRDLEYVRQIRFDYVKQTFYWKDVQPVRTIPADWSHADQVLDEAEYRHIKIIAQISAPPDWAIVKPADPSEPPIDLTALRSFCGDVAGRYKGRIAGYQVWNEPNLNREWAGYPPNAAAYVKLLAVCYDAVHRADPNAIVISAGLAPTGGDGTPTDATPDEDYFRAMYAAGLSGHFDVLGLNAPGYKSSPEFPPDDPSLGGNRWQAFRHVEDMRAIMVANGDGAKQIAILEMGWTTDTRPGSPYAWQGVNEELQADYLVGAYRYAAAHWRPWVGLMVTIYLPDPSWTEENEEYWWSIITPGYSPRIKTAFVALANMDRHMDGVDLPEQPAGGSVYKPLPPRKP